MKGPRTQTIGPKGPNTLILMALSKVCLRIAFPSPFQDLKCLGPEGSKDPRKEVLEPKYFSINGIWTLKL